MKLRELRAEDEEMVRQWRNQPDVAEHMYNDEAITVEGHARWFQAALHDHRRRYWVFEHHGEGVGLGNFYDLDKKHRRANSAMYIARADLRGTGVGALAEYGLFVQAFDVLGLNKVMCEVLETNNRMINSNKAFGVVQEGILRQHVFKHGKPHNVVLMSVLHGEWLARREKLAERLARIEARLDRNAAACIATV